MAREPVRWRPGAAEKLQHYVYLLIDPRTGKAFYVGKGVKDRCFAHVEEAQRTTRDVAGDYEKLETIRAIESEGCTVRIEILRHGLDQATALTIESASIDLLGLDQLTNRVAGHRAGRLSIEDVHARHAATPASIDPNHRVVLIRIARQFRTAMPDDDIYEATRKWWRIGPRKRLLDSPSAPQWAFAIHEGIVRAVFRIQGWQPAQPADYANDPRRRGRWCFVGRRDAAMEKDYVFTDVTQHLPQSAQNPLRFVHCSG